MKKVLLGLLVFSLSFTAMADDRFEYANKQYGEGKYDEAIQAYEDILVSDMESAELYFNLGNAYYKNGSLVDAIINYERALLLKPQDADIKYNLDLAYSQTADKIDVVENFVVAKWVKSLRNKSTSDGWAYYGLIFFLLVLVGLSAFIYSNSAVVKKIGFYLGIVFVLLMGLSFTFSYYQKEHLLVREHAIVISPSLTVKSSPDTNGTELFILHEGIKVKLLTTLGDWCEIEIADGNTGWILLEAITII